MATNYVTLVFAKGGFDRALKRDKPIVLRSGEVAIRLAVQLPDELFKPVRVIDAKVTVPPPLVTKAPLEVEATKPPQIVEPVLLEGGGDAL